MGASIAETPSGMFVLRLHDDTVRRVFVKKGYEKNGYTEIYGQLTEGDVVIAQDVEEIRDGTRVASKKIITNNIAKIQ